MPMVKASITISLKNAAMVEVAAYQLMHDFDKVTDRGTKVTATQTLNASSLEMAMQQTEHAIMTLLVQKAGFLPSAIRVVAKSAEIV